MSSATSRKNFSEFSTKKHIDMARPLDVWALLSHLNDVIALAHTHSHKLYIVVVAWHARLTDWQYELLFPVAEQVSCTPNILVLGPATSLNPAAPASSTDSTPHRIFPHIVSSALLVGARASNGKTNPSAPLNSRRFLWVDIPVAVGAAADDVPSISHAIALKAVELFEQAPSRLFLALRAVRPRVIRDVRQTPLLLPGAQTVLTNDDWEKQAVDILGITPMFWAAHCGDRYKDGETPETYLQRCVGLRETAEGATPLDSVEGRSHGDTGVVLFPFQNQTFSLRFPSLDGPVARTVSQFVIPWGSSRISANLFSSDYSPRFSEATLAAVLVRSKQKIQEHPLLLSVQLEPETESEAEDSFFYVWALPLSICAHFQKSAADILGSLDKAVSRLKHLLPEGSSVCSRVDVDADRDLLFFHFDGEYWAYECNLRQKLLRQLNSSSTPPIPTSLLSLDQAQFCAHNRLTLESFAHIDLFLEANNLPQRVLGATGSEFHGRVEFMSELSAHLAPVPPHQQTKYVVVEGKSGVGKTESAMRAAATASAALRAVWILDCETSDSFAFSLQELGTALGVWDPKSSETSSDQLRISVNTWLENPVNAGWLLIADNVPTDGILWLREKLPRFGGCILITTINFERKQMPSAVVLPLSPPDLRDSVGFLTQEPVDGEERVTLEKLVEDLGHLTLALNIVGRITPKSYSSWLQTQTKQLPSDTKARDPTELAVHAAIHQLGSPEVVQLLEKLSFLACAAIPNALFKNLGGTEAYQAQLVEFGLAVVLAPGVIELHEQVKNAVLGQLSSEVAADRARAVQQTLDLKSSGTEIHALSLASWFKNQGRLEEAGTLLRMVVDSQYKQGAWDNAEIHGIEAIQCLRAVNKKGELAYALGLLGQVYSRLRKFDSAESLFREALALRLETEATEKLCRIPIEYLADILSKQGKLAEAEALFLMSQNDYYKTDRDGIDMLWSKMAVHYQNCGQLEKAAEFGQNALEMRQRRKKEKEQANDTQPKAQQELDRLQYLISISQNILAEIKLQQGHLIEAENFLFDALENRKRDNPELARVHEALGRVYLQKQEYGKAAAQYHTALGLCRKRGNRKQKDQLVAALAGLHLSASQIGNSKQAANSLREAVEIYTQMPEIEKRASSQLEKYREFLNRAVDAEISRRVVVRSTETTLSEQFSRLDRSSASKPEPSWVKTFKPEPKEEGESECVEYLSQQQGSQQSQQKITK
eukprot:TRINITY_DN7998_c0_g1_i5.p1 TRINITY_DN7998_c0_g1~~TRINITY_DN7998_c0_g1_i5.p1  ORF type:complete len:1385 (+),score=318.96 TRINITY_DN7998_c0_g1_i5:484-4155(+)